MGFLSEIGAGIVTLAAVITALTFLMKKMKGPLLTWLGVEKTPEDVYRLVDEVHTGVSFLVGLALAENDPEDDLAPEVMAALQTLQEAGYDVTVGED